MKTDLIWFGCISLPRHFGIFVIFGEDFTEVCMEGEQHNDCLRIFEDQDKCDFSREKCLQERIRRQKT